MPGAVRILIVEDSDRKIGQITELVTRVLPALSVQIDCNKDAAAAAQSLRTFHYDLLVLDINLPLRLGERPRAEGGIEVFRALQRRGDMQRPTHIVGLSEYPDLVEKYSGEFSDEMWYLVHYQDDSEAWAKPLGRMLIHIADTVSPIPSGEYQTDLAILTALHQVELESVLRLDAEWRVRRYEDDSSAYYEGRFTRADRTIRTVAAAASQPGMPAATVLAMKVINRYKPRYLALAGIAAGVRGHFGDILIADTAWDYGAGKSIPLEEYRSAFLPAPSPIPLSPNLKSRLEVFGLDRAVLRAIQQEWDGPGKTYAPLQSIIGPLASGAGVLADRTVIEELLTHNRKLVGVEMETYGVFLAARECIDPKPQALSVKSICDFGDDAKNDAFQAYAAYTSSRYLYEFALSELIETTAVLPIIDDSYGLA